MNIKSSILVALICIIGFSCGSHKKVVVTPPPTISNALDSISYFMGASMAENMKNSGLDSMSTYFVVKGIEDVMLRGIDTISSRENMKFVYEYMKKMKEKIAENNKKKAEEYLKANAKKEGIKILKEGLQYKILKSGDANSQKPQKSSRVKVHYEGKLASGKIFDSSYRRGEPIEFGVRGVIRGWTMILQEMRPGDKWKVFIHPKFGYGKRGAGKDIGANELLIFDIELLSFE